MVKKKEKLKKSEKILPDEHVIQDTLPQNVMKMGRIVQEDKNIYISQPVYKEIHKFTKDKLTNESGGMLVGYTLEEVGKTNIIIDGFIEAKYSEGTPTTLKFTHETWEYVNGVIDEEYSGEKIIGWIHTHPNFGIFLSSYDKFIQENFFNGENQIAYVVDPIQHTEGFFFWIDGKINVCNGFYIYDEIGNPIEIENEQATQQNSKCEALDKNKPHINSYIIVVICLCISMLSALTMIQNHMLTTKINSLSKMVLKQQEMIDSTMTTFGHALSSTDDKIGKCTAVFLNDDGTVFERKILYPGDLVEYPAEGPVKSEDSTFTYSFEKWDQDPVHITGNIIYKPVFKSSYINYNVKFIDFDGNELSSKSYHYGDKVDIPEYTAKKESDETYDYELGWDSDVTDVQGDATYTAVFKEVYKEYIISFVDESGNEIIKQTYHYGDQISVDSPVREDDEEYTYTFEKWDRDFEPVSSDTVYTAVFTKTRKTIRKDVDEQDDSSEEAVKETTTNDAQNGKKESAEEKVVINNG